MKRLFEFLKAGNQGLELNPARDFGMPTCKADTFREHRGSTVTVVALDVSPSMDETDYEPSRREGAKQSYRGYLTAARATEPERLIGLVEFHAGARLVSPPLSVGTAY